MKKRILILLFLINYGFSQIKNGEIIYNVTFNKDSTSAMKSDRIARLFEEVSNVTSLKQKLTFINSKSKYELINKLDDNISKLAVALCNCNKVIYTDLNLKINIYNNTNDSKGLFKKNEFLIIDSLKTNWEITDEMKKIDNFLCYKATQKIKISNPKGIFYKLIIAWFTPEIPIQSGPKGYGGLPGLILQLQDKNIIYGCEKIHLIDNNFNEEIIFPKEGRSIDANEYESILYKRSQERMESIEESKSK